MRDFISLANLLIFMPIIWAWYNLQNSVFREHTGHIEIDHHFIHDELEKENLSLSQLPSMLSNLQLANIFTKSMTQDKHHFFFWQIDASRCAYINLRGSKKVVMKIKDYHKKEKMMHTLIHLRSTSPLYIILVVSKKIECYRQNIRESYILIKQKIVLIRNIWISLLQDCKRPTKFNPIYCSNLRGACWIQHNLNYLNSLFQSKCKKVKFTLLHSTFPNRNMYYWKFYFTSASFLLYPLNLLYL